MSYWKREQALEGVKCEKCQKPLEVSSVFLSCTVADGGPEIGEARISFVCAECQKMTEEE